MTDELPTYPYWDQIPGHLKTRTQLEQTGLKPGGPVRAQVRYIVRRSIRCYDLYDQAEAIAKHPPTAAQRAALAAAQRARRTCASCKTEVTRPGLLDDHRRCAACLAALCRQRRVAVRDAVIRWARELMQRDDWLVLDTETTDLAEHGGVMVEIGILAPDGRVVFQSLVNPLADIAPEAQAVHGITPEELADAPTFAELEPQLRTLLAGKTVVAYHAAFDRGILINDLMRLYRPQVQYWDEVLRQAMTWADASDWQCAMKQYARFVGEPHTHGYRYQRLPGAGHRVVDDGRATIALMQRLAETALTEEEVGLLRAFLRFTTLRILRRGIRLNSPSTCSPPRSLCMRHQLMGAERVVDETIYDKESRTRINRHSS